MAALSLAIGVAALTLLLAASLAFKGALVGSVLGSAVSVQVRASDVIAVVAITLLGVGAVADVLFLNIRERAAELATLLATGWDEPALVRLIALEGTYVGTAGALAGGVIGLLVCAVFATAVPLGLVLTTAAAVAAGVACSAVASVVPSLALVRRPLSQGLADE
jgi:ABC-type antimicrobial peptide transport system permease subunit